MSGLPDTFPCPWCGMSYPARPVLVGKAVRCKGCRNGFVLQADGVATKIQEPPPTQVTVSQVSASAAPAAAPAPAPVRPASASAPRAKPPPADASELAHDVVLPAKQTPAEEVVVLPSRPTPSGPPKSERVAKRKTEHLEAARAQMAAQLAEIQQKAAESEVAKREERKSERIAKSAPSATGKPAGTTSRQAILSGEGHRRHSELRLVWVGIGIVAAVAILLLLVFNLSSATRDALQRYAAPVEAEQNRYPLLGDILRARAWLVSAASMPAGPLLATDLSDASFGAERGILFEPLAPTLALLKGLRYDASLGLWLVPAESEKARTLIAGRSSTDAARILAAAGLRHAVHGQVVQKLGLSDEDATVVLDLLTGDPPRDGEPIAKRILDLGELPDRVVVRPFRGRRGSMLIDLGRPPYKPMQGPYAGTILRFEGDRWPIGWRVLHLRQVQ